MTFQQPATPAQGDAFSLKEHPEWKGALALVYPLKVNDAKQWDPKYAATETVTADIILLDRLDPGNGQPIVLSDSMVFPQVMVAQLKQNLKASPDPVVLGRIGQFRTQNGFDAWEFGEYVPGVDDVLAEQYIAAHPRNQPQQPGGQQAPPAAYTPPQTGWGAAPAAPAQQSWGAPPPPPAAPVIDPGLRQFLESKGVQIPADMTQATAEMLARTFTA